MSDPLHEQLQHLHMPEPSSGAVDNILRAARQQPEGLFGWLMPIKRLKAYLYLPPVRMGVMASVVVGFALLGMLHENPAKILPRETQQVAMINDDVTPYVVWVAEEVKSEDPMDDFWVTASFNVQ